MSLSAQIRSNALADPKLLSDILSEKTDRRIDILRRIADVGSISEAARSAGMSYKSAWQAVETLTNLAGTPRKWWAEQMAAALSSPQPAA